MKKSVGGSYLDTTKTPSFNTNNIIENKKINTFKKRVAEKKGPSSLVDNILCNMNNLYKMVGKNSNMVLKKPSYQNYVEVD
tara:strand:+ start:86 stop:328 length:243 start_codon:yes stop_codon:yes gene_type:complete